MTADTLEPYNLCHRDIAANLVPSTVLLINPSLDLKELTDLINRQIATSPNAAEFMGKYRSKDITESVSEITVKWAAEGRDSRVFVKETLVTKENLGAVLRMMAVGVGRDVFDVKVKVVREKKDEEKVVERGKK